MPVKENEPREMAPPKQIPQPEANESLQERFQQTQTVNIQAALPEPIVPADPLNVTISHDKPVSIQGEEAGLQKQEQESTAKQQDEKQVEEKQAEKSAEQQKDEKSAESSERALQDAVAVPASQEKSLAEGATEANKESVGVHQSKDNEADAIRAPAEQKNENSGDQKVDSSVEPANVTQASTKSADTKEATLEVVEREPTLGKSKSRPSLNHPPSPGKSESKEMIAKSAEDLHKHAHSHSVEAEARPEAVIEAKEVGEPTKPQEMTPKTKKISEFAVQYMNIKVNDALVDLSSTSTYPPPATSI